MFLSLLKLNGNSREVRRDLADCQHLHRTIMSAFPQVESSARAELGVLYRVEVSERGTHVYVQSRVEPDWLRLPVSYCLPGGAACKAVGDKYKAIHQGMVLQFRLRANPTKRLPADCPGERRDGPRVDVRGEVDQLAWLKRKGEAAGFTLLDVQVCPDLADVAVSGGERVRGRHPRGRLTFASAMFEGRLRVEDPELMRRAIEQGIGTAKAYGFGLLSVAPGR